MEFVSLYETLTNDTVSFDTFSKQQWIFTQNKGVSYPKSLANFKIKNLWHLYKQPPLGLWKVDNCQLFGRGLVTKSANETLVFEDRFQTKHKLENNCHHNQFIPTENLWNAKMHTEEFNVATHISRPGYNNFGHVLIDILPNLYLVQKILGHLPIVLKPNDLTAKLEEIITRVFPEINLVPIPNDPYINVRVNRLLVPSDLRNAQYFFPSFRSYANFMRSRFQVSNSRKSGKIFLSRSKYPNTGRHLLNRMAIEELFKGHGFEIIHPELLTIDKQAQILAEAKIVAGEFGAHLHSTLFSHRTLVIVLQSENNPLITQRTLGDCLGHKTITLYGQPQNNRKIAARAKGGTGDFTIDLNRLHSLLKKL